MGVVGLDHEKTRVAATQEHVLEPRALEVDVGKPAAVDVVGLDVVLQPYPLAEQTPGREVRGLGPVALDRLCRVVGLGRVGDPPTSPGQQRNLAARRGVDPLRGHRQAISRWGRDVVRP